VSLNVDFLFSHLNLMVYILHHFNQPVLPGDTVIHGIDSTKPPSDSRLPLATLDIKGRNITIYNDIDCDLDEGNSLSKFYDVLRCVLRYLCIFLSGVLLVFRPLITTSCHFPLQKESILVTVIF